MAQTPGLDTSPFFFAGGPVGCLLIHGFTGAPPEVRPMGEYLATKGLTVLGVRLPGHGTRWEDMEPFRWTDWASEAERGLIQLQQRCTHVFVAGLSMGGLLALYLGARHALAGLIPMSAALHVSNPLLSFAPIGKYFIRAWKKAPPGKNDFVDPEAAKSHWSYDYYPIKPAHELMKLMHHVRASLNEVKAPTLIVQGRLDRLVPVYAAQEIYDKIGSKDKELLILEQSGHCVSIDGEREMLWKKVYQFIISHACSTNS